MCIFKYDFLAHRLLKQMSVCTLLSVSRGFVTYSIKVLGVSGNHYELTGSIHVLEFLPSNRQLWVPMGCVWVHIVLGQQVCTFILTRHEKTYSFHPRRSLRSCCCNETPVCCEPSPYWEKRRKLKVKFTVRKLYSSVMMLTCLTHCIYFQCLERH